MAWLDNTGLYQKYGLEQTVSMAGGEYRTPAELREIEIKLDLTTVGSTDAVITGGDNIFIPAGMRVEQVEVIVDTAVTGATATLNLGLMATDRTTVTATGGFINGLAQTALATAGSKVVLNQGSTGAGTYLSGTNTPSVGYISAKYNTAAFTAGVLIIRIKYRKP